MEVDYDFHLKRGKIVFNFQNKVLFCYFKKARRKTQVFAHGGNPIREHFKWFSSTYFQLLTWTQISLYVIAIKQRVYIIVGGGGILVKTQNVLMR